MNATAANLIERVLPPQSGLRQWVLTFPFSWRRRLAQDGALLGRLTRIVMETVLGFYAARAAQEDGPGAKTGAVGVAQRTSSDLRLNPHLHMVVLDGTWREQDGELAWEGLGHLRTSEVGEVLERVIRRRERHLRRCPQAPAASDEPGRPDLAGGIGTRTHDRTSKFSRRLARPLCQYDGAPWLATVGNLALDLISVPRCPNLHASTGACEDIWP